METTNNTTVNTRKKQKRHKTAASDFQTVEYRKWISFF